MGDYKVATTSQYRIDNITDLDVIRGVMSVRANDPPILNARFLDGTHQAKVEVQLSFAEASGDTLPTLSIVLITEPNKTPPPVQTLSKAQRLQRNQNIKMDYANGLTFLDLSRKYNLGERMCKRIATDGQKGGG